MSFPKDLHYTKEHEWLRVQSNTGSVGITSFAVEQLGDIVHIEMPKIGAKLKKGDAVASVESTKTVSDVFMPVAGTITEINTNLKNAPEKLAEDPHTNGWIAKFTLDGEPSGLMEPAAYEKYIADEAAHH